MKRPFFFLFPFVGIFFILDQYFKYLIRANPAFSADILGQWIRIEYLANPGIAFGIPISNAALVIVTPIIIAILLLLLVKQRSTATALYRFGLLLIVFGAISNLIDRFFFQVTIDYLRIWTGVINLADVMITCGVILLLFADTKKKEKPLFREGGGR